MENKNFKKSKIQELRLRRSVWRKIEGVGRYGVTFRSKIREIGLNSGYFRHFPHSCVQMYIPSIFAAYTANVSQQNGRLFTYKWIFAGQNNIFCKRQISKVLIFSVLFTFVCQESSAKYPGIFS